MKDTQEVDREDHRGEEWEIEQFRWKSLNNETEIGKCRTGLEKPSRLSVE